MVLQSQSQHRVKRHFYGSVHHKPGVSDSLHSNKFLKQSTPEHNGFYCSNVICSLLIKTSSWDSILVIHKYYSDIGLFASSNDIIF